MKGSNTTLRLIVGVLFLALGGVAVFKAWPLLFPKAAVTAPVDPACDLRAGPCTTKMPGGGKVSFGIEPRTIPLVKPLDLKVTLEGIDASAVEIDFSGVDMNMGFNRPKLSKASKGEFAGGGTLPVCVREAMEWEAKVMLHTDRGLVTAPYRFVTVKPGVSLQ
ncbi:hypothetical protein [Solemya velesiana gill symbiont]|uniref:YtkA-like domain-containing protein n=1 Tax=Solemya velesiana gill symbiont TaxID=1918948 RepID=A0A1T2KXR6_9GAMM|nr:hypothetical protein [Solemya velesiana gill symbiont]OOZ37649.1 hypothetical protein BOW51_01305 [Solemya velesiana gill symbiont]